METETNYKYQKVGLMVLSKALDDICPTFEAEAKEERVLKIEERIKFFDISEVELDAEWEELEKEAEEELKSFLKERDSVLSKLRKTKNTSRVLAKIEDFEAKREDRTLYLVRRHNREAELLAEKLKAAKPESRQYKRIKQKMDDLDKSLEEKVRNSELRYNTIIKNTLNSDNSERFEKRYAHSQEVWDRKYQELKAKHLLKESIHNNRRMELDQVRIAHYGFIFEIEMIKHWCLLSGVSLLDCYAEVRKRLEMMRRETETIDFILEKLRMGEDVGVEGVVNMTDLALKVLRNVILDRE